VFVADSDPMLLLEPLNGADRGSPLVRDIVLSATAVGPRGLIGLGEVRGMVTPAEQLDISVK
jgi:hypothetical protein